MRVFYKFILPIRPHNVLANKRMKIPSNKSLVLPFKHSRIDNYISNKFIVSTIPYKRVEQKLFELFVNQI